MISCPSCARQQFEVIKTVEVLEKRLAHITTPMTLSVIGCVVNGPGEARETDIGFTGGGNGTHQVYIAGVPAHRLKDESIVDHLVELVEKKAAEIEAAQGQGSRSGGTPSLNARMAASAAGSRHPGSSARRACGAIAPSSRPRARIAERYGYRGDRDADLRIHRGVLAADRRDAPTSSRRRCTRFTDRGGEEITLRPEYTAGIVRAVISNGLTQSLPLKFFARGPMFRYERPQKGRFRQFHQIDVELIGAAQPLADVEVIALGAEILDALGVLQAHACSSSTRSATPTAAHAYRAALVDYYAAAPRRAVARTAAAGSNAIRCAFSIRRTRATSASMPTRRLSPTI